MENNIGALVVSVVSSGVLASTIAAIANAKKTKSEAVKVEAEVTSAGVNTSITTMQQVVNILTVELKECKAELKANNDEYRKRDSEKDKLISELQAEVLQLQHQIIELQAKHSQN